MESGAAAALPLNDVCLVEFGGWRVESGVKGGTPARPNKLRNRKNLRANPLSVASFVSPLPKKFATQYFSGALQSGGRFLD